MLLCLYQATELLSVDVVSPEPSPFSSRIICCVPLPSAVTTIISPTSISSEVVEVNVSSEITLDELVFGNIQRVEIDAVRKVLSEVEWYVQIPGDKQEKIVYHLSELMMLIEEAK